MKPSTIFGRWIKANAASIAGEPEAFQHLVVTVSTTLEMIELNPNGLSPATADYANETLAKLKAEIEARGMTPPDIRLPKIKVVLPSVRQSGGQ